MHKNNSFLATALLHCVSAQAAESSFMYDIAMHGIANCLSSQLKLKYIEGQMTVHTFSFCFMQICKCLDEQQEVCHCY